MEDKGEIIIYQTPEGKTELEVKLDRDTLWLSQRQMSLLFEKDTDTIGLHLRNIYKEGELEESATTEESSVVQKEGNRRVRRTIRLYNLDAVLSVGYRVNSKRGTQFRIWANRVLMIPATPPEENAPPYCPLVPGGLRASALHGRSGRRDAPCLHPFPSGNLRVSHPA